jgi:4-nitrophenyl phosphatase
MPEPDAARLRSLRAFVLDMDGVLYRGQTPLPGAAEALVALRRRGRVLMLTNNSTKVSSLLTAWLRSLGFAIALEEILVVTEVAEGWLRRQLPGRRLLVLGEDHFRRRLGSAGFTVVDDWRRAEAVVVACRLDLRHDDLGAALNALRAGAAFVATNPDLTVDGDDGLRLEAGAYARMLAGLCGREPTVIGKPEAPMYDAAFARLGIVRADASAVAMIGDNPDTDIAGARRNGLFGVHVLSGVAREPAAEADLVVADLAAFARVLESGSA